jgi:hypothetical protein
VAERYVSDETLSTEHSLIDDNGDGRGTEVQIDYLTEKQGGRLKEGKSPPPLRENGDGAFSSRMILPPPPVKPLEEPPPAAAVEPN